MLSVLQYDLAPCRGDFFVRRVIAPFFLVFLIGVPLSTLLLHDVTFVTRGGARICVRHAHHELVFGWVHSGRKP